MTLPPRYYSNLPRQARSRPSDGLPASGVLADPTVPKSIIGIAYPTTHIGGCRPTDDPRLDSKPPEVVWHLVLDRAWRDEKVVPLESKDSLDGRFVLRDGEFIELAEDTT